MVQQPNTSLQYGEIAKKCRLVFKLKTEDYGTSWRIFRMSSLTDQLYIKANRIRNIEEGTKQLIEDSVESEFMGLVNYGLIALIQLELPADQSELEPTKTMELYDRVALQTKELMLKKNHDYGEAWRQMRLSSLTDLILVKIRRLKQMEDNAGNTNISEGADANYMDIINYAMFALIRIEERNTQSN